MEAVQVAVRVGPAAPGQHIGVKVALVGHVERGGEFGRLDLHVKAGIARHGLDHQRNALRVRGGGRDQCEARVGHAGRLQQGPRFLHIALGHGHILGVVAVGRCHPLVANLGLVVHHHLGQALAVQRQLKRLAHARIAPERVLLRLVALADVDGDALVADLGDARHLELLLDLQLLHVGRGDAFDEIELARLQVGQPHGGVGDRGVGDLGEVDGALVPVAVVAFQRDAVLRHPLHKLESAGADRLEAELVAGGLRRLGRDHHAGAVGQDGQQRGKRRAQVQAHCHRVDHIDAADRAQLAPAVGTGHGFVALDVELDGSGVEFFAVMKSHAGANLHCQRLAVGRPLIALGQLGHDGQLFIHIQQFVAQRREHHPADKAARQGRVQHIGVFGQAHAQGLGLGQADQQQGGRGEGFLHHVKLLFN